MHNNVAGKRKQRTMNQSFDQKIRRRNSHVHNLEIKSMRFLKLLWLWSAGSQDLMVHAWETQQALNEDFCNTDVLSLPLVLQKVREHLCPSHPAYAQEVSFLAYPEVGAQRKHWLRTWKYYAEWKLARTVVDKNVTQGVAVPPEWILTTHASLLKGSDEVIPDFMAEMAMQWWNDMSQNARTIWLCRWRKAWGFKFGTLQPRGYILAEEVQKKAPLHQKHAFWSLEIQAQNCLILLFELKIYSRNVPFCKPVQCLLF